MNELVQSPFFKLREFINEEEKKIDRSLHESFKLSLSQALILIHLLDNPDISQRDVACERNITPAAVCRHMESLVSAGLITQCNAENNKREHCISLTPKGEKLVKELCDRLQKLTKNISWNK